MNRRWWEKPACLVCDYWYLILLGVGILLVAYFTRNLWLPILGLDSGSTNSASVAGAPSTQITGVPEGTAASAPNAIADIGSEWTIVERPVYSIEYPASWYASPQINSNSGYDLILSNAPGNEDPQSATDEETARLSSSLNDLLAGQSFVEWVISTFAWLNADISPIEINGLPALTATIPDSGSPMEYVYTWVDMGDRVLSLEGHYLSSDLIARQQISQMIESVLLAQ